MTNLPVRWGDGMNNPSNGGDDFEMVGWYPFTDYIWMLVGPFFKYSISIKYLEVLPLAKLEKLHLQSGKY